MAMSHIEPLLLLLTSLFFLPAFRVRGLDFQYCNGTGHDFGSITSVEVDPEISFGPDDIKTVTITVNGYADIASKSRNWSLVQVIRKVNNYEALIASYDPCQLIECPVKPGTKFLLSLSNVRYFPDVVFVNKYAVRLVEYDEENRSNKLATIFCVDFHITFKALTLVSPSLSTGR